MTTPPSSRWILGEFRCKEEKKEEEKKQPTVVHASVYTTEQSTAQQLTIQEGEQVPAQSKLLIILLMRQQERVRQQLLTGADLQVSVCCPASSRSKIKKKISKCRVATTETGWRDRSNVGDRIQHWGDRKSKNCSNKNSCVGIVTWKLWANRWVRSHLLGLSVTVWLEEMPLISKFNPLNTSVLCVST